MNSFFVNLFKFRNTDTCQATIFATDIAWNRAINITTKRISTKLISYVSLDIMNDGISTKFIKSIVFCVDIMDICTKHILSIFLNYIKHLFHAASRFSF